MFFSLKTHDAIYIDLLNTNSDNIMAYRLLSSTGYFKHNKTVMFDKDNNIFVTYKKNVLQFIFDKVIKTNYNKELANDEGYTKANIQTSGDYLFKITYRLSNELSQIIDFNMVTSIISLVKSIPIYNNYLTYYTYTNILSILIPINREIKEIKKDTYYTRLYDYFNKIKPPSDYIITTIIKLPGNQYSQKEIIIKSKEHSINLIISMEFIKISYESYSFIFIYDDVHHVLQLKTIETPRSHKANTNKDIENNVLIKKLNLSLSIINDLIMKSEKMKSKTE